MLQYQAQHEKQYEKQYEKVDVVTVATHTQGYLQSLKWCLSRAPGNQLVRFVELGRGQRWTNYLDKIRLFNDYLLSTCDNRSDDDIVIFCDAYDVLYDPQRDFSRIIDLFRATNVDLLFSVVDLSKHNRMVQLCARQILACLDISQGMYTCNAGLYMGRRRALAVFIQHICKSMADQIDDERCINRLFNECCTSPWLDTSFGDGFGYFNIDLGKQYRVALDIGERIFKNRLTPLSPLCLVRKLGAPRTAFEEGHAFFYHFIGNQDLDELCKHEGIWIPGTIGNCEIYGNVDKFSHYLKFFNNELATITLIFGLTALVLLATNKP